MLIVIVGVLAVAGAFVAGVLVGRRNRQKVETAVAQVNKTLGL